MFSIISNTNDNQYSGFFYSVSYKSLILILALLLTINTSAQSDVIVIIPDNQPDKILDDPQSKFDLDSQFYSQQSAIESLTKNCEPVEYGSTAAFITLLIPNKNSMLPLIDIPAKWMPAMPNNPDATIVGIDSDGDCVRDDIERYIGKLYREKGHKRIRKYLFEYVKWLGIFIKINHWSIDTTRTIYRNVYRASECVRRIHGDSKNTRALLDKLFANFHNTFDRSVRQIRNNAKLGGWVTREKIPVSCG